MNIKTKILIPSPFYFPGYKAGGALRTVTNMVNHLSDDFEFWIITRDRDLGDTAAYTDIRHNQWQQVGDAMVYYLSPESCTIRGIGKLISETEHDILYINSFFDPDFTIKPLLARRFGLIPNKPAVVAPRGEFSTGAIKLKYLKKTIYIQFAKLLNLYGNVTWQASSELELQDIIRIMHENPEFIHIALDLPARATAPEKIDVSVNSNSDNNVLKVIFLSRISQKKNLDYALKVLCKVKTVVAFDIYGPAEDPDYWQLCTDLIKELPTNVTVKHLGSVHPDQVPEIFSLYDLFFFPTLGENYGHVIAESLSVGTPVLLSDQTPWRDMRPERLGWDFALDNMDAFVKIIEEYATIPATKKHDRRRYIIKKTVERLANPKVFEDNRDLFQCAINRWKVVR